MKNVYPLLFAFFSFVTLKSQTLPPVAQALYDEAYSHDTMMGQFVLNHGAQVFATPDSNSFYLQWFPTGFVPSSTPLIVTLHGSNGYAFIEFKNWYDQAQLHGFGIIALQWYKGITTFPPNDYLNDTVMYTDIDSALKKINYPSGKAFLHGFSRGSARSFAIAFLDSHVGQNYFCTILSNAGGADTLYPLYSKINSGMYGNDVFDGKQWALFCGGLDTNYNQSGCPGMIRTQEWIQSFGATVGLFIQDSLLGHDGFHDVPAYMDSVLNYYSECFNGTVFQDEVSFSGKMNVYPNPTKGSIYIELLDQKFTLEVFDITGRKIYSEKNINSHARIDCSNLNNGIYFLSISEHNNTCTKKIVIMN